MAKTNSTNSVQRPESNTEVYKRTLGKGEITKLINPNQLLEQNLKPYQDKLKLAEDRIDISKNKLQALKELKSLVSAFKNANDRLVDNGPNGVFSQRYGDISTSDIGSSNDYLKISTNSTAEQDSYDISVAQLATKAKTVVAKDEVVNEEGIKDGTLDGFDYQDQPMKSTNIHIVVNNKNGTVDVNIDLDSNDSLIDITNKINNNLGLSQEISARILSYPENAIGPKYFLELLSNDLGAASIETAFTMNDDANEFAKRELYGTNARIIVDGSASIESSINKLEIAKGVIIEALKVNSIGKAQEVTIKNDVDAAKEGIIDLFNAWNNYAKFSAKQRERDADRKFVDTAYLARSPELTMADGLVQKVLTSMNGFNLPSLGFELIKVEGIEDIPAHREFTLNTKTFEQALNNDFGQISSLFKGKQMIEADANNKGSSISFVNKEVPNSLNGLECAIEVTIDAAGKVKDIEYTTNGDIFTNVQYNPDTKIISFIGTELEGLELHYNQNGIVNNDELFMITYSQGISEKLDINLKNLVNDRAAYNGLKKGAIDRAIADLSARQTELQRQRDRTQKIIDDKRKRMELQFKQIEIAEAKLKLSTSIFESMYNNK